MELLAEKCALVWNDCDALTALLKEHIHNIPHCRLLYATDIEGIQISANVLIGQVDHNVLHQDLSQRPFLRRVSPCGDIVLSDAYLSQQNREPCITATRAVIKDKTLLGFIAVDFDIRDLPDVDSAPRYHLPGWQQFRGDPAIRKQLFHQERVPSLLDENIDFLNDVLITLLQGHGVYHGKIHFSSSRCTLWSMEDPFNYHLLSLEALTNPDLFFVYSKQAYPPSAVVTKEKVPQVLAQFKALRHGDNTIYLRSGSINIMNGLVGLTFSCDGSHYMTVDEFLEKELSFWFGPSPGCLLPKTA